MKKLTKATIAAGTGVILLIGGAGTVAYWTDEADGGTGVIQSGTLELGDVTGGEWMISHTGDGDGAATDPVAFTPGDDQVVPGDELTYTQDVPVTLAGENIAAAFAGSIDVEATSGDAADTALAAAIESDADLSVDSGSSGVTIEDDVITGPADGTVAVTTTITFPWGTEGEFNDAMLGSLDFSVDYTLTQVPAN